MNELTSLLDAGCNIIIKLAVVCALLALARLLVALSKPKQQTLIWANTNCVATESSGSGYQFVLTPTPEALPQPATIAAPPPPKEEPEVPQNVVCGNCNNEIKSTPIEQESKQEGSATIYRCESCGMRVRMPLARSEA